MKKSSTDKPQEKERSSLPKRARRYASVSAQAAQVGVRVAVARAMGGKAHSPFEAALLRAALGGLKGPLMKIAQLIAVIPDLLPREVAAELATLQADAPPMGWPFVRRRMAVELGAHWQSLFKSFEPMACAAASLGQVHKATGKDGRALACKLQYPDMGSVVEADLQQLKLLFGLFERFSGAVMTGEAFAEIAERLREELDYGREAQNMALYGKILADVKDVHVPKAVPALSTSRLLTMTWMAGEKLTDEVIKARSQAERNKIAETLFRAWYKPFYTYGVIHGDPHLGNYTVRPDNSLNLLDFGCIRVFKPEFVQAIIMLYAALREDDEAELVEAFRLWGFEKPSKALVAALGHWARFVYAPFLEDRVTAMAETNATAAGRAVASQVYGELKKIGGVSVPRPFVLMDRASVGLGGVFLRLGAEANWHTLFHEMTDGFDLKLLKQKQDSVLSPFTALRK
ncbi:MAG: AarF/ABC1/UbiB kinase family protein [Bdellovibrionales bacterium]|jgi:predicted unusual protein kinase regulating ubiquinone biosynthesis (AarF/ABC1/UbiB family)